MGIDSDWGQIISIEISHQLEMYQQIQIFFMASYLVYSIIYSYIFEELLARKDMDILE
jgi:hypothetical protein